MNTSSLNSAFRLLLIVLSLLIVTEYYTGRFFLGFDITRQYVAAQQLAYGNGLTKPIFNANDLSNPGREIVAEFPPGLSILVAPLFTVFENVQTVHLVFSFVTIILFLWLSYLLARKFASKKRVHQLIPIALLFLSLNGIFLLNAGSSDMLCIILSLAAALSLIKYFESGKRMKFLFFACLGMASTVYFRYAYFPALLVVPAFFLARIVFFKLKNFHSLKWSIILTVVSAIPFVSHIAFINNQTEYIDDTASQGEGLYLEHLLYMDPFPFNTFFDRIPILRFLGYTSDFGYDRGYDYPWIVYFIFIIASIIILSIPSIHLKKSIAKSQPKNKALNFALYAGILSVGLICFLIFASVINPSTSAEYNWSWLRVFRYYLLPAFFIQFSYFLIIAKSSSRVLKQSATVVIISGLLFSAGLKVYNYSGNYVPFDFKKNTQELRSNAAMLHAYLIHKAIPAEKGNRKVFLISSKLQVHIALHEQIAGLSNASVAYIDENRVEPYKSSSTVEVYLFYPIGSEVNSPHFQESDIIFFKNINGRISVYRTALFSIP